MSALTGTLDVMSLSEAWAYASSVVGEEFLIGGVTDYYSSISLLMQHEGWSVATDSLGNVLYYYRPSSAVLTSGVKTYTEIAEVTAVTTSETGAITGATVTTTGVGVTVAETAIAGALAACLGYTIGNSIYDVNQEWWNGLLKPIDDWIVDNVPENGVNGIITVLNGIDTVLTLPSDLINKAKVYLLDSGIDEKSLKQSVPIGTFDGTSLPFTSANIYNMLLKGRRISSDGNRWKNVSALDLSNLASNMYNQAVSDLTGNYGATASDVSCFRIFLRGDDGVSFIEYNLGNLKDLVYEEGNSNVTSAPNCTIGGRIRFNTYSNSTGRLDRNYPINGVLSIDDYYIGKTNVGISSLNNVLEGAVKGVSVQENATTPTSEPISTTYPSWWDRRLPITVGKKDSSDTETGSEWLPVSIPNNDIASLGITTPQVDAQSGTETKEELENNNNISIPSYNPPDNPPSNDNGNTPVIVNPTSSSGIAGIYNPTLDQIREFSNWLWSENPITQLLQMFNNPMNGIIGLHLLYATPHVGDTKSIGVGYLDSHVLSKVVDEQYITIDCGTVDVPSYFNNVHDWLPYTKISCYLPFIGIVSLNTNDLVGSKLNITYKVDVLTGACLALLTVSRDNLDSVLYQFSGDCAVQIPLTSGNYGSVITSLATTVVGAVGTVMSEGALLPVMVGGAFSLANSKANTQRSGQLASNVGAMGIKKPYLIIQRPIVNYANSYPHDIGFPSNKTVQLKSCSGFTRVKAVDVNNINTSEEERKMIYDLLTNGIYV